MTLPRDFYDPDRPCPKCGTHHNTVVVVAPVSEEQWENVKFLARYGYPAIGWRQGAHPELMYRTCHHCGHYWDELPLDHDELEEEVSV